MKDKKYPYRVQALDRGLDILDCFNFQNREMTLSEIVDKTGLNKTTAKRLLSNLTYRGYLETNQKSKSYRLGLRLFELGGVVFSSFSLREAATRYIQDLQKETAAIVLLGTKIENELVYVDKIENQGMIRVSSEIGWRRPLHYGMLGMTLLAYTSENKVREILEKTPLEAHTPNSITDMDALSLRLEKIRRHGYVVEKEEVIEGIIGIAGPIRDYSRKVIAALGIALTLGQISHKYDIDKYAKMVTDACDKISSDLGYLRI